MKNHLNKIILILISICTNTFAQDLIVKKNGEEIIAKIIEVGALNVKYKNFTNIEGPTYVIDKADIIFVKYKNGEKEIYNKTTIENKNLNTVDQLSLSNGFYKGDQKIDKNEFLKLLSTNTKAIDEYKSGKKLIVLGSVFAGVGGGLVGYSLGSSADGSELLIAGALVGASGFVVAITGALQKQQAIKTYNAKKTVTFNVNINRNGLGLAMNF